MSKYRNSLAISSDIDGVIFFKGDEVINDFTDATTKHIAKWICISQGKVNDVTYPPVFKPLYISADEFTLNGNGTRGIELKTLVTNIVIKASANLSAFKVGTTSGGQDIIGVQPVSSAGPVVFPIGTFFDAATTLYFEGITALTEILIYQE